MILYDDDLITGVGNPTHRVRDLGAAMAKTRDRHQHQLLLNLQLYLRAKISLHAFDGLAAVVAEQGCPPRSETLRVRDQHQARRVMALARASVTPQDTKAAREALPFDFGWRREDYTDPKTQFEYAFVHAETGYRE